jgi:hypothetical protein
MPKPATLDSEELLGYGLRLTESLMPVALASTSHGQSTQGMLTTGEEPVLSRLS